MSIESKNQPSTHDLGKFLILALVDPSLTAANPGRSRKVPHLAIP
ncbi:MAG: hypothetical protein P2A85_16065 [Microcoleus anatoxicus]